MRSFTFQNPTKLIFGKDKISSLAHEIDKNKKIMITFGGGSVKKNGVYDQVKQALQGFSTVEFWGIEPNPSIETLRKAITLGKAENIDFLLAVGGGSVLDGTKLIASAIPSQYDGWDLVIGKHPIEKILPFATVLTLPATGSEMNAGAVISKHETQEKFAFTATHPQFSILDPTVTFSLPPYQIACGIADTFVHVIEQYLTKTNESPLMDRWAEGILQTLIEIAPKIKADTHDYDTMSTFMLSATMALNGFVAMGVTQDWCTHMIGHELTALHGIAHGETLAIVLPGTMTVLKEQKAGKIRQLGERVFNIKQADPQDAITQTIAQTETFFRSLGLKTRLSEHGIGQDTINEIEKRFTARNVCFGENQNVNGALTRKILEQVL
ncbi:NADH-dependent alcohol dehydrogenase [Bacteroidia bacterium]|nr:NADH-dependent alcohol dehydrogenase [Bacteroidia bacterium]